MKLRNIACALALIISTQSTFAAPSADETDIYDLDFTENLSTPAIPSKWSDNIRDKMKDIAVKLYKQGYKVETMRKGEVVVASLPTDKLFPPNDSTLTKQASELLKPFITFVDHPDNYKVIMAVHSDDTGSEAYQLDLTTARVQSVYDWFERYARDTSMLVGYPMGATEPLAPNNSRVRRAANRRLELYIVPLPPSKK